MGCFSHVVATLLVQQGSRATGMSHAFLEVSVENGVGGAELGAGVRAWILSALAAFPYQGKQKCLSFSNGKITVFWYATNYLLPYLFAL